MIKFKGKEYPTRTFVVEFDEMQHTYTIATESLAEALGVHSGEDLTGRAEDIDQSIYYYVEDDQIELGADEICNDLLDIPMEFIKEIK
jgi:hypothetical protein